MLKKNLRKEVRGEVVDWAKGLDRKLEKVGKAFGIKIITSAGPWRAYDVHVDYDWDMNTAKVDFYSPVRLWGSRQKEAVDYATDLVARLGIVRKQLINKFGLKRAKKEFEKFRKGELEVSEELYRKKLEEVLGD